jgi:replicative DNA helicase
MPSYRAGLVPVTSGYTAIDEALKGGFRPESLYALAGRTGAAKTTLGLNIVRRSAMLGTCVLICKIEESKLETAWRIHAAAARVPLVTLLDGATKATSSQREQLAEGWELIQSLPIRISSSRDLAQIESTVHQHAERQGQLVVIDQLSQIAVPDATVGYPQVTEASNRLRALAVDTRLPIVVICQVNRAAAKQTDARLTCHDLRDSGAIENDCAGVLMISRAQPGVNGADPMTLEMLILKNRYGPATAASDSPLELHWYPAIQRIEEVRHDGEGLP